MIQIGAEIPNEPNGSIRAVVDAFLVKDLRLFGQILADHQILKVLHAPSEDFRIFLHLFKALPKNVFDTQCAAAVSDVIPGAGGNGNCIGYGKLCKEQHFPIEELELYFILPLLVRYLRLPPSPTT